MTRRKAIGLVILLGITASVNFDSVGAEALAANNVPFPQFGVPQLSTSGNVGFCAYLAEASENDALRQDDWAKLSKSYIRHQQSGYDVGVGFAMGSAISTATQYDTSLDDSASALYEAFQCDKVYNYARG